MGFLSEKTTLPGGVIRNAYKELLVRGRLAYCHVHTTTVCLNMECSVAVIMTERHFFFTV